MVWPYKPPTLTNPKLCRGGVAKQELLRDFVLKCYKPNNDYEGNKASRLKLRFLGFVAGIC